MAIRQNQDEDLDEDDEDLIDPEEGDDDDEDEQPAKKRYASRSESSDRSQSTPSGSGLDIEALANLVASKVGGSKVEKEETADEVVEAMRVMKANGYSDDWIKSHYLNAQAVEKKTQRMIQTEIQKALGQVQGQTQMEKVNNTVSKAIREASKDFEGLKKLAPAIQTDIEKEYMADSTRAAQWRVGICDFDKLADIVDEKIDEFADLLEGKKSDKKGKASGMKVLQGGSSDKRSKEDAGRNDVKKSNQIDIDKLDDHQLEAYRAAHLNNKKLMGMSEEDAKVDAYNHAIKLVRPKRSLSAQEKLARM